MPKSGPEPSSFSYPPGKFYSSFKAWTVSCPSEIFLDPTHLHTTLDLFSMLHTCVCLVTQSCLTLCDLMNCSLSGSSVHWGSPGKNTEVGCYALLQGIFPTQGSNPHLLGLLCLLHWQAGSLPVVLPGKPIYLYTGI